MNQGDLPDGATIERRCARCGTQFPCGAGTAQGCWCAALPPLAVSSYTPGSGCLCRRCLQAAIELARIA